MSSDAPRPKIDASVAHAARVYDYWLGGKDNYAADRALGEAMMDSIPSLPFMARANRAFLGRAVQYLAAEAEIRQFLDIGTGIPTAGNVHEVAQSVEPRCRVLYVDHDPLVLTHAQAFLTSTPQGQADFIMADLREPEVILNDPMLAKTLDLDQPVALMLVAILMYFHDHENPQDWVSTLLDALPSGSYLTITHPSADFDAEGFHTAAAAARSAGITLVSRSKAGVEGLFDGLELVEPGVVPILNWRPEDEPEDPNAAYFWGGMGRKP
jgi:hypothetical protein